jgi:hypothetical protein
VDSPRWPCDLDWSRGAYLRQRDSKGRELDGILRALFRALTWEASNGGGRRVMGLSMFPTPRYNYFARCASDPRCKPHLRAVASELFAPLSSDGTATGLAPSGGAIFTRFMLSGFATYRALERLGVTAFESYPDLQFRLSSPSTPLPPKGRRTDAMAARRRVVARLAVENKVREMRDPATLDQADAAVLALATARAERRGVMAVASNTGEGRFMISLDAPQARRLGLGALDNRRIKAVQG